MFQTPCERCPRRGKSSFAIAFCSNCNEAFCKQCATPHEQLKTYSSHTLMNIGKIASISEVTGLYEDNNAINKQHRKVVESNILTGITVDSNEQELYKNPIGSHISEQCTKLNDFIKKLEIIGKEQHDKQQQLHIHSTIINTKILEAKRQMIGQLNLLEGNLKLNEHNKERVDDLKRKLDSS